jgi:hypothetical protein
MKDASDGVVLEGLGEAWGSWMAGVDEMWFGEGGIVGGMK